MEQLLEKCSVPKLEEQIWDIFGSAHRADLVKQTKIKMNEKELLQLVDAFLRGKGLMNAASALRKEANIKPINVRQKEGFKAPANRKTSRDLDGKFRQRSGSLNSSAGPVPKIKEFFRIVKRLMVIL